MTERNPPTSAAAIDPALLSRAKNIIVRPAAEWPVIEQEFATVKRLFTGYAMILAAIGPVATLLGGQLMPLMGMGMPIVGALIVAAVTYVLSLAGVYVTGLVINALAPSFGGVKDQVQAMKLAVYSWTAAWLVGIVGLVPALSFVAIAGLYSFYLLYIGLPVQMKVTSDKTLPYFIVILLVGLGIYVAMGMIIAAVSVPYLLLSTATAPALMTF